jgi:hypothetical protein
MCEAIQVSAGADICDVFHFSSSKIQLKMEIKIFKYKKTDEKISMHKE